MKKIITLLAIMVLAAACNKEKEYTEDLTGTWQVYKYTLFGGDKSDNFNGYTITFTNDGHFVEMDTTPSLTTSTGAYSFRNDFRQLVLTDSTMIQVDTVWVPKINERKFTIFNISRVHLQLRNDSSELYLQKPDK